ncbi:MAG: hypothetical protein IKS39_07060 [Clostridia bacterium]|nr:hypothetical protein [Clostridia bacterium]
MTSRCEFCSYRERCKMFYNAFHFWPYQYPFYYKTDTPEEKKFKQMKIR